MHYIAWLYLGAFASGGAAGFIVWMYCRLANINEHIPAEDLFEPLVGVLVVVAACLFVVATASLFLSGTVSWYWLIVLPGAVVAVGLGWLWWYVKKRELAFEERRSA